jgi:sulfate adenylyltransferase subunit 1
MNAGSNTPLATNVDTLRFSTAGSVDDGKSTLIGRLLFDAQGIFEDQLVALAGATKKHGHVEAGEPLDFSLLTDGLIAEREQGITIDVAYRYFTTAKRRFIIADTPGHEQYTRNMVTGASTADLTIILVDASRGLSVQSRRHAVIAGLLRIPHVVIAINKMDLVGYAESAFEKLRDEFEPFIAQLGFANVTFIPLSALKGEMLAKRGSAMPWYTGPTLLEVLESSTAHRIAGRGFRFPVQRVGKAKFGPHNDLRGYQGRVDGGAIRIGDAVTVLPVGAEAKVVAIETYRGARVEASSGEVVSIVLDRQLDVSRGDVIVGNAETTAGSRAPAPLVATDFVADLCWLDVTPLDTARRYWLKHTTRTTRAVVGEIQYRLNINTLDKLDVKVHSLNMNEIARVRVSTPQPLVLDAYAENRLTGSFILIDDATNRTVGAGMMIGEPN